MRYGAMRYGLTGGEYGLGTAFKYPGVFVEDTIHLTEWFSPKKDTTKWNETTKATTGFSNIGKTSRQKWNIL